MPEIYDQKDQPKERTGDEKYSEAFKEFVKPGVGETRQGTEAGDDKREIEKARATLRVGREDGHEYKPITKPEGIVADQFHRENIDRNPVREGRSEKNRHLGAKVLAGLTAIAGVLGLVHKVSEKQEEVNRRKAEDIAPIAKSVHDNVTRNEVHRNAEEAGAFNNSKETTQYVSGGQTFNVENDKK